jgi:acyl carrier protein
MNDSEFDRSAIAETVEEIWRGLLSVPMESEDETFFELGGESISAVRIVTRIEEALGVEIDVADVFNDDPTLGELIRMVATRALPPATAA